MDLDLLGNGGSVSEGLHNPAVELLSKGLIFSGGGGCVGLVVAHEVGIVTGAGLGEVIIMDLATLIESGALEGTILFDAGGLGCVELISDFVEKVEGVCEGRHGRR